MVRLNPHPLSATRAPVITSAISPVASASNRESQRALRPRTARSGSLSPPRSHHASAVSEAAAAKSPTPRRIHGHLVHIDQQMDQHSRLAGRLQLPLLNRVPGLLVPQHDWGDRCHPSPSEPVLTADLFLGEYVATRLNMDTAAPRPSVISTASPSRSRSDGQGADAGWGADRRGSRDLAHFAGARQPPGEQRGCPRVQIGLAREPASSGSIRCAAFKSSAAASLPALEANAICARTRSTCALLELVQGPSLRRGQQLESPVESARLTFACAAASARAARRAGSGVSTTARSRNAAAAATPPRACARPADRSSSAATSSSGPLPPSHRCHARRSGSSSAVSCVRQRLVRRPALRSDAERYTAERTNGCRNRT